MKDDEEYLRTEYFQRGRALYEFVMAARYQRLVNVRSVQVINDGDKTMIYEVVYESARHALQSD